MLMGKNKIKFSKKPFGRIWFGLPLTVHVFDYHIIRKE